jgi:hypothetical protein
MSHKNLSLIDKLSVIKDAEEFGRHFASSEWDISRSSVRYLLNNKEEYLKARHDAVAKDVEKALTREGEALHPHENAVLSSKIILGIFFMFNFIFIQKVMRKICGCCCGGVGCCFCGGSCCCCCRVGTL